jgi:hypothetical protein
MVCSLACHHYNKTSETYEEKMFVLTVSFGAIGSMALGLYGRSGWGSKTAHSMTREVKKKKKKEEGNWVSLIPSRPYSQ